MPPPGRGRYTQAGQTRLQEHVVFESLLSSMGFLGFIIVPLALAYGFDLLKTVIAGLLPAAPAPAPAPASANTFASRKTGAPRPGANPEEREAFVREAASAPGAPRPAAPEPANEPVMVGAVELREFDYAEFRSADCSQ